MLIFIKLCRQRNKLYNYILIEIAIIIIVFAHTKGSFFGIIIMSKGKTTERTNDMETITVKEVNGYKVEKYANTRGQYFVNIREGNGFREFHTFRTIKDAVKFIETAL